MIYKQFRDNKEIGKLIQYAYDLHKRDFKAFPSLPDFEFSDGCGLHYGKTYEDGGMYGNVLFDNHSDVNALITLVVMRGLDSNHRNPKSALCIQTKSGEYNPSFCGLIQDSKSKKLEFDHEFNKLTDLEQIDIFINYLEFLGFRKEDILKVINNQMTAREAYQNVAPEEYKNRQWICYNRKFYEFDGNVAISGDYSGVYIDRFPFPFKEQPILDCSKVTTACIYFGYNKKGVKLINVNFNPDSIVYTDIREAVIDEVIDASKVRISGTKFGEQRVINLEHSLGRFNEKYLALAYTDSQEEISKNKINVMSNASNIDTMIEGLDSGAEGIGLFRDELVLENNPEIISGLLDIINSWRCCTDDDPVFDKIYDAIYCNATKMYSIVNDKQIVFRLTDIKVDELIRKSKIKLDGEETEKYRGADALYKLGKLLESEVRAIINSAKEYNKTAIILVPYFSSCSSFLGIKNQIIEIAQKEDYNNVIIGAMIENVESALLSDEIAEVADFISIGTNDLTESVLNKKRSINDKDFYVLNEEVKNYIRKIVHRVKRKRNIPINICGEHANIFENLEYYLSLDIDTITCNSNLVYGYIDFISRYYESENKDSNNNQKLLIKNDN